MNQHHQDSNHPPVSSIRLWLGITCIMLGVLLLLQTLRIIRLHNWWALLILIPASESFASAVRRFRRHGNRFTGSVAEAISSGLFLGAVGILFLLRANWAYYWPLFIVLAGVSVLLGAIAATCRNVPRRP